MYHSITFGSGSWTDWTGAVKWKNTWTDWHLIPVTRPTMAMPQYSQNFVEIPGMDGSYDMSTWLTGKPTFADRTGSFEFYVDNDHENWITIYRNIAAFLHGKRMMMILEDDCGYYYEGRFAVSGWKSDKSNSIITIEYRVGPYKWNRITNGSSDIIWDIFNFETDNDWFPYAEIIVQGSTMSCYYPGKKTPVVTDVINMPIPGYDYPYRLWVEALEVTSPITVTFNENTMVLSSKGAAGGVGPAANGNNRLTVTGNGRIKVAFQDAML